MSDSWWMWSKLLFSLLTLHSRGKIFKWGPCSGQCEHNIMHLQAEVNCSRVMLAGGKISAADVTTLWQSSRTSLLWFLQPPGLVAQEMSEANVEPCRNPKVSTNLCCQLWPTRENWQYLAPVRVILLLLSEGPWHVLSVEVFSESCLSVLTPGSVACLWCTVQWQPWKMHVAMELFLSHGCTPAWCLVLGSCLLPPYLRQLLHSCGPHSKPSLRKAGLRCQETQGEPLTAIPSFLSHHTFPRGLHWVYG